MGAAPWAGDMLPEGPGEARAGVKGLVGSKGRLWDFVNIKGTRLPASSFDEMRGTGLHSFHEAERRL